MDYPITQKQFDLFKRECVVWQKRFGMSCYELMFERISDLGARATILACPVDMMATVAIGAKWDTRPTQIEIKKAAMHEMAELFLWDIREMLRDLYNEDVVNRKIHQIIRTLENLFFP